MEAQQWIIYCNVTLCLIQRYAIETNFTRNWGWFGLQGLFGFALIWYLSYIYIYHKYPASDYEIQIQNSDRIVFKPGVWLENFYSVYNF